MFEVMLPGPDILQLTFIISPLDPCLLTCRRGSVGKPRGRVKDGTRCNINPMIKDVCIEGICKVKIKRMDLVKHLRSSNGAKGTRQERRHGARGTGQKVEGKRH